jgi:glutamate dehydrogenase (NAD(P)+)
MESTPSLQVTITDEGTGLRAYVVADTLVEGRSMGGTRMTPTVTLEEVAALAYKMTLKLSLAEIPMGGAKAGIVCDALADQDRDRHLTAFGTAVRPLLHGGIYLGTDQGVTHRDRDVFFKAAQYDLVRNTEHGRQMRCPWTEFWQTYTADVTGYGVCQGTFTAVELLRLSDRCHTVALQGFGAVGRGVAIGLAGRGFDLVAVADHLGTVADPKGMPLETLLNATDARGTIDRALLPEAWRVEGRDEAWLDVEADVLVLAAGGDAIHAGNVDRVRAKMVVEGANLACTEEAQARLAARGVPVLPDILVNCGGASVTGLILTGLAPVSLPPKELTAWLYEEIGGRIRRNVTTVIQRAVAEGKHFPLVTRELALERLRSRSSMRTMVTA